jgi:uncharacterized protein
MVRREIEPILRSLADGYPALAITGPRQSGKTTLAQMVFPDRPYVSMEDPDIRELARRDPRGFLEKYRGGAVLDEVQNTPELFSYLQGVLDSSRMMGRFILTGSQQFGLLAGITQSLAGRIAMIQLLPFSFAEAYGTSPVALPDVLLKGSYPPVHDRKLDPALWYANYVQTYVERDVRKLINVRDLSTFQRFLRLCAGRVGQLLSLSEIASDAGITHNTARAWISLLEASYIVFRLGPHFRNFNKRVIKTPKLYFHDPGLACWLLAIRTPEQVEAHPLRGAIFENWVISEMLKTRSNHGLPSSLYFWRDRAGHEVDVVIETAEALIGVEIKAGQTVNSDYFKGLDRWMEIAQPQPPRSWLVYGGREGHQRGHTRVLSWRDLRELTDLL